MDDEFEKAPYVHHITESRVAFPYLDYEHGGFGQVIVELKPGERETITIPNSGGTRITVVRDYVN